MKLNIFNQWKTLGKYFGRNITYQTSRVQGTKNTFATYVKDAESNAVIAKAYGTSADASKDSVMKVLTGAGADAIWDAIQSGQPIVPSAPQQRKPEPQVQWRDGIGHSHRAQKKIVGENFKPSKKDDTVKARNFVAKHARAVNKAGPMKDRKNEYTRKPKNKKLDDRSQ